MKGLPKTSVCLIPACLLISLIGLCFVAVLTFNSAISELSPPWRKPLIGSIFSSICIFGIISALFPSKCSHLFRFRTQSGEDVSNEAVGRRIQLLGHHPNCGRFSSHVLTIGERTFCAGCVGLTLGAVASLLGAFLYFFADFPLIESHILVFWGGFIGVALGLLQYHLFKFERNFIHTSLDSVFVLGASLLLMGADAITKSLSLALYILVLDTFWIYTRIELSQWRHKTICDRCEVEQCSSYLRPSL